MWLLLQRIFAGIGRALRRPWEAYGSGARRAARERSGRGLDRPEEPGVRPHRALPPTEQAPD